LEATAVESTWLIIVMTAGGAWFYHFSQPVDTNCVMTRIWN
jgi:hypothetical protein